MSSTNRGGDRHASDYYVTPVDEIVRFLKHWDDTEKGSYRPLMQRPLQVLDPCAGGDPNTPMSYLQAFEESSIEVEYVDTIDIRQDSRASRKDDFLAMNPAPLYDMVISNPPFSHALQFVEQAMRFTVPGGVVIMLLRLNFLGSIERGDWLKRNVPTSIHVHSKRIGFKRHMTHLPASERNKTDSIEYAHFCWRVGDSPKHSRTYVI